jgi:hypothetical protein
MKVLKGFLVGAFAFAFGPFALAQDEAQNRNWALRPLSTADGQSSGPTFLDAATIEAGTSDTKANIGISGFLPKSGSGDWYQQYGFGGEAAIAKGSSEDASVGSLSELSKGSSAKASYSWIHWRRLTKEEFDLRLTFCREKFPGLIGKYGWDDAQLIPEDVASCDSGLFTAERLAKVVGALEVQVKACAEGKSKLPTEKCDRLKELGEPKLLPAPALDKVLNEIQMAWAVQEMPAGPAHFISFGAKANRAKANYFVLPDLTELKKDHVTGYGGTASYSYFRRSYLLTGGFSLERSYKNNDEVEVCTPIPDTTSTQCITGAIGAPKYGYARIGFAEGRWLLGKGKIAIAPRAEYDFTGSTYAVRFPVYLAPDKNKSLIGGIVVGYTDKDDEGLGISVFIGKAFSFFE